MLMRRLFFVIAIATGSLAVERVGAASRGPGAALAFAVDGLSCGAVHGLG